MINKNDRTEEEINRTMEYLDEIDTLDPSPFFYSRLTARMESHAAIENSLPARFFGMSALKPALAAALIIINICSIALLFPGTQTEKDGREENLMTLAEEYQLIQTNNPIKELFE